MASYLDLIRQRQQQPVAPLVDLATPVQGLLQGYMQGTEMRRQREADQRAKLLFDQQQEDRQRKLDLEKLQAYDEIAGRAASLGQGRTAIDAYGKGRGLRESLYGYSGPEIKGGVEVDPQGTAMRDIGAAAFGNPLMAMGLGAPGAMGNATDLLSTPTTRINPNDPTTLSTIMGLTKYKPDYEYVDPAKDVWLNGVLKHKGTPKEPPLSGRYKVINGQLVDLETQSPVYSAPMNPYQQAQVGQGQQRIDETIRHNQQTEHLGSERLGLENIKTKAAAVKFRTMAEARFRNEFTDDEGNFNKEAFDEAMARVDSNLAALNLDGGAEAKKAAVLKQKQQKARQAANGDVSRVLGGELAVASELFPGEVAQLTDYYQRRQMGETPGRAPVSAERIRQMREGVKQYLRGGKKPAKAAAAPAAKPSPKASAAAILKKYQQNPSAFEVEAGDDD